MWKCRNISMLGRIQVTKTHIFSQVRFLTNFVKPTKEFLTEFRKIVDDYVWDGSVKIKRSSAIGEYDEGGLKLPDMESILNSQKIMWVHRYLSSLFHPWKIFFKIQLDKLGDVRFIYSKNLDVNVIKNKDLNEQYKDILIAWAEYNAKPIDPTNILDQHIFL